MGKSKSNVERLNTLPTDLAALGAALATKQTVTGSHGGNAALISLLDKLTLLGLITNGTTV